MDNTVMPDGMKEAGLRMSTDEHPGKGRGPIKVKRHDVEQFFLDNNRDLFYQVDAVARVLGKPRTSVATHLTRMTGRGVIKIQDTNAKYGERAYQVSPSFNKLSRMQTREYTGFRPDKEVMGFHGRSEGSRTPPFPSDIEVSDDHMKEVKRMVLENFTKEEQPLKSVSELIDTLEVTLSIARMDLDRLKESYDALKSKVGAIL